MVSRYGAGQQYADDRETDSTYHQRVQSLKELFVDRDTMIDHSEKEATTRMVADALEDTERYGQIVHANTEVLEDIREAYENSICRDSFGEGQYEIDAEVVEAYDSVDDMVNDLAWKTYTQEVEAELDLALKEQELDVELQNTRARENSRYLQNGADRYTEEQSVK